jgi:hypothetical protein
VTITATINMNGDLILSANTELEVFALTEWERRRKGGKASHVIPTDVTKPERPAQTGGQTETNLGRYVAELSLIGPSTIQALADHLGISVPGAYQYMSLAKSRGLVNNKGGQWSIVK